MKYTNWKELNRDKVRANKKKKLNDLLSLIEKEHNNMIDTESVFEDQQTFFDTKAQQGILFKYWRNENEPMQFEIYIIPYEDALRYDNWNGYGYEITGGTEHSNSNKCISKEQKEYNDSHQQKMQEFYKKQSSI